jgi:toxin ParE1/3/4
MTRIIKRPAAKRDLIEQANFIALDNLEAALRFLDAAERTFASLARLPRIGKSRKVKSYIFADVRQVPITGFEKHLVFYRPIKGGIEILRVLHGARDLRKIIDEENPEIR